MRHHINFKKTVTIVFFLTILSSIYYNPIFAQNDLSCRSEHLVVEPTSMTETLLENVIQSFGNCLCVQNDSPFHCILIVNDTVVIIRLLQGFDVLQPYPYVCIYKNIPIFITHYSDVSQLFRLTQQYICSDSLFDNNCGENGIIPGYSMIDDNDYYEARFHVDNGAYVFCCEHPCISDSVEIPHLKPQNIHVVRKSLKKLQIYSPYVSDNSYAEVLLNVKFNNIREMKVERINNISYLIVYNFKSDSSQGKVSFIYDGCEISDTVLYNFYQCKIKETVPDLNFFVPKKYKFFNKIKRKYGYDQYLITKYSVNDSEPVLLTFKIIPME